MSNEEVKTKPDGGASALTAGLEVMRKTQWYSGHQYPIREGWYERDYTSIFGGGNDPLPHVHLDLWLQRSPGDGYWYVDEPKGQINDAYYEQLPWRGITSNAELSGPRPLAAEGSDSNDVLCGGG